jgi:hypothetical protein
MAATATASFVIHGKKHVDEGCFTVWSKTLDALRLLQ